jgi:hypothetical protein
MVGFPRLRGQTPEPSAAGCAGQLFALVVLLVAGMGARCEGDYDVLYLDIPEFELKEGQPSRDFKVRACNDEASGVVPHAVGIAFDLGAPTSDAYDKRG